MTTFDDLLRMSVKLKAEGKTSSARLLYDTAEYVDKLEDVVEAARFIVLNKRNFIKGDFDGVASDAIDRLAAALKKVQS